MLPQRAEAESQAAVKQPPVLVVSPGVQAVERLRAAWEPLPAKTPMQLYIWSRACAEAFAQGGVKVVTCGTPVVTGIAAFVKSSQVDEYLPLGAELFEQVDLPVASDTAAGELAEAVARLDKSVYFNDISASSVFVRELRKACGRRLVATPRPGHPWIDLDDTWLEPEAHLNSGRRSDLRRARRNAEKLGSVQVEILSPAPDSVDSLLNEAFRVESASWKGRSGSALAIDNQVGKFYRHFARAASEQGILRLCLLSIGDRAVAMQLAVKIGEDFWLFKMGYDEEFARCSPGQLLMVESLRYAREQGCSRYELTGQSEPWNQVWTQQLHPALRVHIHRPGMNGWVRAATEVFRGAISSRLRRDGGKRQ